MVLNCGPQRQLQMQYKRGFLGKVGPIIFNTKRGLKRILNYEVYLFSLSVFAYKI